MQLDQQQKLYNGIVGNEQENVYIIYNNIIPAIRTTYILKETILLWRKFTIAALTNKPKTRERKIFTKILNFKIPGYSFFCNKYLNFLKDFC